MNIKKKLFFNKSNFVWQKYPTGCSFTLKRHRNTTINYAGNYSAFRNWIATIMF